MKSFSVAGAKGVVETPLNYRRYHPLRYPDSPQKTACLHRLTAVVIFPGQEGDHKLAARQKSKRPEPSLAKEFLQADESCGQLLETQLR